MSRVEGMGSSGVKDPQFSPQAEAKEWVRATVPEKFAQVRSDGGPPKRSATYKAMYSSFVAPLASPVTIGSSTYNTLLEVAKVDPELAQTILDERNKAIQEFLDSWADDIAKHAKLDKQAAVRAEAKSKLNEIQRKAYDIAKQSIERAKAEPPAMSKARPSTVAPRAVHQAPSAMAMGPGPGVNGAFGGANGALPNNRPTSGVQIRNRRFG